MLEAAQPPHLTMSMSSSEPVPPFKSVPLTGEGPARDGSTGSVVSGRAKGPGCRGETGGGASWTGEAGGESVVL
jgi:hypothetical protein